MRAALGASRGRRRARDSDRVVDARAAWRLSRCPAGHCGRASARSNWRRPTCRGCTRSASTWACSSSAAAITFVDQRPVRRCFRRGTAHERTSRKRCVRAAARERPALEASAGTARSSSRRSRCASCCSSAPGSWLEPSISVQQNPVGFRPQGVLTMTFDLAGRGTRYGRDAAERAAFHERLLTPCAPNRAFSRRDRQRGCRLRRSSTARTHRASCDSTSRTGQWRPTSGHSPGWK